MAKRDEWLAIEEETAVDQKSRFLLNLSLSFSLSLVQTMMQWHLLERDAFVASSFKQPEEHFVLPLMTSHII